MVNKIITVVVWFLVGAAVLAGGWFTGKYDRDQRDREEAVIASAAQNIVLTSQEVKTYEKSLAPFALGDDKPLNQWLDNLQKQKRYGWLPAIPEDVYRNDIRWIGERALLTAPSN